MPRATHRKSRSGCLTCRSRRIKCDERKPSCFQCEKHGATCDYLSAKPSSLEEHPKVAESDVVDTVGADLEAVASLQRAPVGFPLDVSPLTSRVNGRLELRSLALLYHYIFEACDDTFRNAKTNQIWKQEVPRLALEHEFLMRGILALSAIHRAHSSGPLDVETEMTTLEHHSSALGLYWPAMNRIDASNGEALFAFALLLTPLGFCSPDSRDEPLKKAVNCIGFCRGMRLLRDQASIWVRSGSLAALADFHGPAGHDVETVEVGEEYWRFRGHEIGNPNRELDRLLTTIEEFSAERRGAYRVAIESLRGCFIHIGKAQMLEVPPAQIPAWLSDLPEIFVQQLRQEHPLPTVILAYYCVAFRASEQRWFAKDWAWSTLLDIRRKLPKGWEGWLDWPMQAMDTIIANGHPSV